MFYIMFCEDVRQVHASKLLTVANGGAGHYLEEMQECGELSPHPATNAHRVGALLRAASMAASQAAAAAGAPLACTTACLPSASPQDHATSSTSSLQGHAVSRGERGPDVLGPAVVSQLLHTNSSCRPRITGRCIA